MRNIMMWGSAYVAICGVLLAQQSNDALRKKVKDLELAGNWFYDDLEAGFKEARESGKPMLVVFR